jgi:hypothetical protein
VQVTVQICPSFWFARIRVIYSNINKDSHRIAFLDRNLARGRCRGARQTRFRLKSRMEGSVTISLLHETLTGVSRDSVVDPTRLSSGNCFANKTTPRRFLIYCAKLTLRGPRANSYTNSVSSWADVDTNFVLNYLKVDDYKI